MKISAKKRIKRWSISFIHSIWMLVFLAIWNSLNFSLDLERYLFQWQSSLKNTTTIRKLYHPPLTIDDALFIDTSTGQVDIFDSTTNENILITDRKLLDSLLGEFTRNAQYKFIICDLSFETPTQLDSVLALTISKVQNIIFADPDSSFSNATLSKLKTGHSSYAYLSGYNLSDVLLKFSLIHKNRKSIPLMAYEAIKQIEMNKKGSFIYSSDKKIFTNNIIVDASVQLDNLKNTNNNSFLYGIQDVLSLFKYSNSEEKKLLLKDKIILIGDFKNDLHTTAFGEMPGTLILYNILTSLFNQENLIDIPWLTFIILGFTGISYITFFLNIAWPKKIKTEISWLLGVIAGSLTVNIVLLFSIGIFSYLIFSRSIEIIALSLWLSLVEYIILLKRIRKKYFRSRPITTFNILRFLFYH